MTSSLAAQLSAAFHRALSDSAADRSAAWTELRRVAEEYARERRALGASLADTLSRLVSLHQRAFGSDREFRHVLDRAGAWVTAVYAEEIASGTVTPRETRAAGSPLVLLDEVLRTCSRAPNDPDCATALLAAVVEFVREQHRAGRPLHRVQARLEAMARLNVPAGPHLDLVLEWMSEWSAEVFRDERRA